jgi:hypothetical protein
VVHQAVDYRSSHGGITKDLAQRPKALLEVTITDARS